MRQQTSIRQLAAWAALAGLALLAGCGGVHVTAENTLPRPLVEELPLRAGVYYSAEFRSYTAREKRAGTQWEIILGGAHVAAIDRLTKAMFESVVTVTELGKPPPAPLDVVLEPRFEEYSFLTPRDSGSEIYSVTIKYRINIYDGAARLIDSLVLTGFGNEPAGALSSGAPLAAATRKAMRDAGAKFAAQFPDQPVVRKLLRHEPVPPIAPESAAAEGSVGEVQPAAGKPAPPAPASKPAAAAAVPAAVAPAAAPPPPAAAPASGAAPAAAPPVPPTAAPAPPPTPGTGPAAPATAPPAQAPPPDAPAPDAPPPSPPPDPAPPPR